MKFQFVPRLILRVQQERNQMMTIRKCGQSRKVTENVSWPFVLTCILHTQRIVYHLYYAEMYSQGDMSSLKVYNYPGLHSVRVQKPTLSRESPGSDFNARPCFWATGTPGYRDMCWLNILSLVHCNALFTVTCSEIKMPYTCLLSRLAMYNPYVILRHRYQSYNSHQSLHVRDSACFPPPFSLIHTHTHTHTHTAQIWV